MKKLPWIIVAILAIAVVILTYFIISNDDTPRAIDKTRENSEQSEEGDSDHVDDNSDEVSNRVDGEHPSDQTDAIQQAVDAQKARLNDDPNMATHSLAALSFNYPKNSEVISSDPFSIEIPYDAGTNITHKGLRVEINNNWPPEQNSAINCNDPNVPDGVAYNQVENSNTFAVPSTLAIWSDGAAGSRYETHSYSVHNLDHCVYFRFLIRYTNLGNYDEDIRPNDFDRDREYAIFEEIMNSVESGYFG